jgi:CDP-diacylglycerol pyrophosphatase
MPRLAWLLAAFAVLASGSARAADPDALWKIVNGRCVPDQQEHADPKPCASVDLAGGTALLKDIVGPAQFLLIPTAKITGIESPAILAPDAPNYFAAAWADRAAVSAALGKPVARDETVLAINSAWARSQNQLHIHIDCLSIPVIDALHAHLAEIGTSWAKLPVKLEGHTYLARRLDEAALATTNPFQLLAKDVPGAAEAMGKQTLALVGATFADGVPGVILLTDHVDLATGDMAHGEELQDHACAATGRPS